MTSRRIAKLQLRAGGFGLDVPRRSGEVLRGILRLRVDRTLLLGSGGIGPAGGGFALLAELVTERRLLGCRFRQRCRGIHSRLGCEFPEGRSHLFVFG